MEEEEEAWASANGCADASPPYEPPEGKPSKFGIGAKQTGGDGRMWVVRAKPGPGMKEEWWPAGSDGKEAVLPKVGAQGKLPQKPASAKQQPVGTKRTAPSAEVEERGGKRRRGDTKGGKE